MGPEGLFDGAPAGARRLAVAGWPLGHTLSPALHGAAISRFGLSAVYRAAPVAPADWEPFARWALSGGLDGFNLTLPHKEAVLAPSLEAWVAPTPAARAIGAANTLARNGPGEPWTADNTDAPGLLEDLAAKDRGWMGGDVVVLGAGGAARAVLFALAALSERPPRRITIFNRNPARALAMLESLRPLLVRVRDIGVAPDPASALEGARLLVNATSLGLAEGDPSPVPPGGLRPGLAVMDLIYHRETALLRDARDRGAKALDGLGMLVNQAALAFERWFGEELKKKIDYSPDALRETMTRAARAALADRKAP